MSKSDWTLLVSVAFLVASFLGLPERLERFKPVLQIAAWIFLAVAVLGWLWVHGSALQEWRTKVGNGLVTLSVVGIIGGVMAVGLFLSWAPTPPKQSRIVETADQMEQLLGPVANAYREAVAEIVHALEPRARVTVGGEVIGPDGARTMDIQVWSVDDTDRHRTTVIDVIDRRDAKPVSIDAVDIADSKRKDLGVDAMLIASNTGFDAAAIRKAKRIGIGLITVLKRGDGRVKGVIEEEIYLRKIKVSDVTFGFDGVEAKDRTALKSLKDLTGISYADAPIAMWLVMQASKLIGTNLSSRYFTGTKEKKDAGVIATFAFKEPVSVMHEGRAINLKGVSVAFNWHIEWLSQTVKLDATTAIYDYRRSRVRMGPGKQEYVISGVNFATAKPLDGPPPDWKLGFGLQPGEIQMEFVILEGFAVAPTPPPELARAFAAIEERVRPEDLALRSKGND